MLWIDLRLIECFLFPQADRRKAVTESLMLSEKYCFLSTCRRKFLLEYFGEDIDFTSCGKLYSDLDLLFLSDGSFSLRFCSFTQWTQINEKGQR